MEQTALDNRRESSPADRRRQSRRFSIASPARFTWLDTDGGWHTGKGMTRDISLHGVFVATHSVPVPGTVVEVDVAIPPLKKAGAAIRLLGRGRVLRIEPPDSQPRGFAAQVNFQSTGIGASFDSNSETEIH